VDISGVESTPRDLSFNDHGTKLFVAGGDSEAVHEYTMSSQYDTTTLSHNNSYDVSNDGTGVAALTFNDDGARMYVAFSSSETVQSYGLDTAFDLSTAKPNKSLDISSEGSGAGGIVFDNDGSTLLGTSGNTEDKIYEYELSTAYDISTASYTGDSYDVSSDGHDNPSGLAWGEGGAKLFVSDATAWSIHVYDSSALHTIDLEESNVHLLTLEADAQLSFSGVDTSRVNSLTLRLQQDGTGGRSPSWPSNVEWGSGSEPSWSTDANAVDIPTFFYDPDRDVWYGFLGGLDFA
jgi:6-phosphogluconolactonase (cycloisomerase 2 family)